MCVLSYFLACIFCLSFFKSGGVFILLRLLWNKRPGIYGETISNYIEFHLLVELLTLGLSTFDI